MTRERAPVLPVSRPSVPAARPAISSAAAAAAADSGGWSVFSKGETRGPGRRAARAAQPARQGGGSGQ